MIEGDGDDGGDGDGGDGDGEGDFGGEERGFGSGLMTTTFWSVMISSAESRREKPSESSRFSSAKNSKVLVLKAKANF